MELDYAPPTKRSVLIAGHQTSISLEPMFWRALEAAARERSCPVNALVAKIDAMRLEADHRRISHPLSGSGSFSSVQDRPDEGRASIGGMVEEQRGLDELEFHDPQRSFVVGDDVDPRVSRWRRSRR